MTKQMIVVMMTVVLCAAMTHAGVRADLSGDAVVDFATTMDMPFMTVGNPGNAGEISGGVFEGAGSLPAHITGAVGYTYNIGKFEVTAGQYTEFLNAVAATDTYDLYNPDMGVAVFSGCRITRSGSSGSYTYSVPADWADRPVNYVSWGDSARFANWLTNGMPTGGQDLTTTEDGSYLLDGKTGWGLIDVTRRADAHYVLPNEDEWYKAAYHKNDGVTGNYFDYPTGSDTIPANDLVDPDPGNSANFHDGDWTLIPDGRTEVGEFENSASPYGAFDMGGNVQEWLGDFIVEGLLPGLRGGSFNIDDTRDLLHASFRFGGHEHDFEMFLQGFRLAEVPEPATMTLLALGGVGLLRRQKSQICRGGK